MNIMYLKDCVICGRYIAISTGKKLPTISLRVPVIARRNTFKTCSSECSKKNSELLHLRASKRRNPNIEQLEVNEHKIEIGINWRILKSRDKFIQFCKDNNLIYNGNYDVNIVTKQEVETE